MSTSERITVVGAGGRAGRAVTAAARRRGLAVTAVVRDPGRHPGLGDDGADVVAGDVLRPGSVPVEGAVALVSAVTPFTAPPADFAGFDGGYYARVADQLIATARHGGVRRVVVIGLFAALPTAAGGLVADDPALFPAHLRPFAHAHAAGVERFRSSAPDLDWIVLAPPPGLAPDAPVRRRHRLADGVLDPAAAALPLSYADLAEAVVEEILTPTRHREQVAVHGADPATARPGPSSPG